MDARARALIGPILSLGFAAVSCGDAGAPEDRTSISGRLVEVATGRPVVGRVTGFPDLGAVETSSPAATFLLEGARFGTRYRLVAEAQGYLEAEVSVVPRFPETPEVEIELSPAIACPAGQRRCARGGAEGIEICQPDGRGFRLEPCGAAQVCDAAAVTCVGAPMVRVSVSGSGSVISTPSGLLCNPTCQRSFPVGTALVLEARSFGDSAFVGWGGACSGTAPRCELRVDADRAVEASFQTVAYRLTASVAGGPGTITSEPSGIDCGAQCQAFFPAGSMVQLTAAPGPERELQRWELGCSGSAPTCTVTMSEARQVRARFQRPGPVLEVVREGPGVGTVRSTPAGIDCGTDCSSGFALNSEVVLRATAPLGSRFATWGGDCAAAGDDPACTVRMSAARRVTARFEGDTVEVTARLAGGGVGTVRSNPSGIDCGTSCAARFPRGGMVELTATPGAGALFFGWSDACAPAGEAATCMLVADAARTATARFEPFWLAPLPADSSCRYALGFDLPERLRPRCAAAAPPAVAVGWAPVPSRSSRLGDGLLGPATPAPIDIGPVSPTAVPATVELSIRRDGGAGTLYVDHDRLDPGRAGLSVRALGDGRLVATTFDGAGGATSATTAAGALPASSWAHVAVVLRAAALSIVVEGRELVRTAEPLRWTASSSAAWAGAAREGSAAVEGWVGAIDELRISDGARY